MRISRSLLATLALAASLPALGAPAPAGAYQAADDGQRPAARGTYVLPEQFLRGFDPVTVYYDPSKPQDATLERKAAGSVLGIVIGIFFFLLGCCMGAGGLVIFLGDFS